MKTLEFYFWGIFSYPVIAIMIIMESIGKK